MLLHQQDKMDNDYHRYILTYNMDLSPQQILLVKFTKLNTVVTGKKLVRLQLMMMDQMVEGTITVKFSDIDWKQTVLVTQVQN